MLAKLSQPGNAGGWLMGRLQSSALGQFLIIFSTFLVLLWGCVRSILARSGKTGNQWVLFIEWFLCMDAIFKPLMDINLFYVKHLRSVLLLYSLS